MSVESVELRAGAALLRAALPAGCAAVVEAVISCRSGCFVSLDRLAAALGMDPLAASSAFRAADRSFKRVFGLALADWRPSLADAGSDRAPAGGIDRLPLRLHLANAFADLVERPPDPAPRSVGIAPPFTGNAARWVAGLAASPRRRGLHLGLRADGDGARPFRDFAALLAEAGVKAFTADASCDGLAAALLRADLHLSLTGSVVFVDASLLEREDQGEDARFAEIGGGPESPSAFVLSASNWLAEMQATCIWCIPVGAAIPGALGSIVAGCIGPLVPDAGWARATISAVIGGGVGGAGVAAIAATLDDPRDADARCGAARLLAEGGIAIDEACRVVAGSLVPSSSAMPAREEFDPALIAPDGELALALARAGEIALAGGRLIFHGPPGGGKSSLARALAARMEASGAAGPPVVVTAASILVKPLGGTERLLDRLWSRADLARSPLVVDELDAMCGVRDASAGSGGNAYLVRVLTDEWLRQFDAHPGVPVLATVNDLRAIDPAVVRRFHAHYAIGDGLPPHLERRAWASILGMDPPPRWRPCGAAPADFVSAKVRCRMLGLWDADSLADAVRRAREARRFDPAELVSRERTH